MKRMCLMVGVMILSSPAAWALDPFARPVAPVEEGNRLFREGHYDQAMEQYERAEQLISEEPRVHFNRGDALFKLGRFKEAREAYLRALGLTDPALKKQNYYNIGNTFLAEKAFRDAISYYRRALEIDPAYDDARTNLEIAVRAIEEQEKKQKEGDQDKDKNKKDQEGKDQKDQQDKQDQKDQKDKDQKDQQGKQDQKDQKDKDKNKKDQQDQKDQQGADQKKPEAHEQEKKEGALSQRQVQDLLDSLRENEKPFQMQIFQPPQVEQRKVEKDW